MESKNTIRSERTRTALMDTARDLFARDGYAATSTPSIVKEAEVSRGALYHHFRDKADLFLAVVEREYKTVAGAIEAAAGAATEHTDDAIAVLLAGGDAFLDAMRDPGRRRILLIDGPAVLGPETMREIDARHTGRTLRMGVNEAVACGAFRDMPVDALADVIDAAYDRVAMVEGDDQVHRLVLREVLNGLRA